MKDDPAAAVLDRRRFALGALALGAVIEHVTLTSRDAVRNVRGTQSYAIIGRVSKQLTQIALAANGQQYSGSAQYNVPSYIVHSATSSSGTQLSNGTVASTVNSDNSLTIASSMALYSGQKTSATFTLPSPGNTPTNGALSFTDSKDVTHNVAISNPAGNNAGTWTDTFSYNGVPCSLTISTPDGTNYSFTATYGSQSTSWTEVNPMQAAACALHSRLASVDKDVHVDGVTQVQRDELIALVPCGCHCQGGILALLALLAAAFGFGAAAGIGWAAWASAGASGAGAALGGWHWATCG